MFALGRHTGNLHVYKLTVQLSTMKFSCCPLGALLIIATNVGLITAQPQTQGTYNSLLYYYIVFIKVYCIVATFVQCGHSAVHLYYRSQSPLLRSVTDLLDKKSYSIL